MRNCNFLKKIDFEKNLGIFLNKWRVRTNAAGIGMSGFNRNDRLLGHVATSWKTKVLLPRGVGIWYILNF